MSLDSKKLRLIIDALKKKIPKLQAVYLFGSQSDGTFSDESDIDIAYLSDSSLSSLERWYISCELAILLNCDIDLVELQKTNTIFRYQIISNGKRIYGNSYDIEIFETLAYSFYLRFIQERQPIVDEIIKNSSIFGKTDD